MQKLNARQKLFVAEYLVDKNGTQAAIRAGYSKASAGAIAAENLKKPHVAAGIAEAMTQRIKRTEVDSDWLLTRLAAECNADLADIYNKDGGLLPIHDWPLVWRQGLVVGVESKQEFLYEDGKKIPDGWVVKVKLSDRVKRQSMIGEHTDVAAFLRKEDNGKGGTEALAEAMKALVGKLPD